MILLFYTSCWYFMFSLIFNVFLFLIFSSLRQTDNVIWNNIYFSSKITSRPNFVKILSKIYLGYIKSKIIVRTYSNVHLHCVIELYMYEQLYNYFIIYIILFIIVKLCVQTLICEKVIRMNRSIQYVIQLYGIFHLSVHFSNIKSKWIYVHFFYWYVYFISIHGPLKKNQFHIKFRKKRKIPYKFVKKKLWQQYLTNMYTFKMHRNGKRYHFTFRILFTASRQCRCRISTINFPVVIARVTFYRNLCKVNSTTLLACHFKVNPKYLRPTLARRSNILFCTRTETVNGSISLQVRFNARNFRFFIRFGFRTE